MINLPGRANQTGALHWQKGKKNDAARQPLPVRVDAFLNILNFSPGNRAAQAL
jgi:hypothetical protein